MASQLELGGSQDHRLTAFKKLITSVADDLGREDVEAICFMYSMPRENYSCSALKILARLESDGEFSPGDIQPLQKLLEDIKRQDICSKHIEKYLQDYQGRHCSTPSASLSTPRPELPRRSNTCPSNNISTFSRPAGIQESSTTGSHVLVQPTPIDMENTILESSQEEVFSPPISRHRHFSEQMYHVGDVSTSQSTFSSAPWSSQPSSRQQSQENFLSSGQHSQENNLENSTEVSGTFSTASTPWYEQGTLKTSRSSSQMYTQSPHNFRGQGGHRTQQSFRSVQSSLIQSQQRERLSVDETGDPRSRVSAGTNIAPAIPYSQSYPVEMSRNTLMPGSTSDNSQDTLHASLSHTHDRQDMKLPEESPSAIRGEPTQQIPTIPKKKLGARQKLQAVLGRSKAQESFTWTLKRYPLCKAALKQKERPQMECCSKVELVNDQGPNPKLAFSLHPYGIEEDENKNITLVVAIEVPKKIQLHSSAEVHLTMSAKAQGTDEYFFRGRVEKQLMLLRKFFVKGFLEHESLKQSHCKCIDIEFNAVLKQ